MEGFRNVVRHTHKFVIHGGRVHALCHKVTNGPSGIAQTERERCWVLRVRYSRESGSPPASCVMTLVNEKVRRRRSSWDGQGPRKAVS